MASDADAAPRSVRGRSSGGHTVSYLLLFATGVLVLNAFAGESGLLATRMASRQQAALAERIAAMKAENEALREQARRLQDDPTFIEEIARRELGLIRRGERVFLLRRAPAAPRSAPTPRTGP